MKKLIAVLLFLSISELSVAQPDIDKRFIGTWILQGIENKLENGDWVPGGPLGDDPFGILMYDEAGNITAQLVKRDRSIPDPEDVIAEVVNGYVAYVGIYEVDEKAGIITHHRSAHINPDLDDISAARYFRFKEDILTLTIAPDQMARLIWKRQD